MCVSKCDLVKTTILPLTQIPFDTILDSCNNIINDVLESIKNDPSKIDADENSIKLYVLELYIDKMFNGTTDDIKHKLLEVILNKDADGYYELANNNQGIMYLMKFDNDNDDNTIENTKGIDEQANAMADMLLSLYMVAKTFDNTNYLQKAIIDAVELNFKKVYAKNVNNVINKSKKIKNNYMLIIYDMINYVDKEAQLVLYAAINYALNIKEQDAVPIFLQAIVNSIDSITHNSDSNYSKLFKANMDNWLKKEYPNKYK